MANAAKRDFTDAKEIISAIEGSDDPVRAAIAVIGLAAGVIEHRRGPLVAAQFLRAAAGAISKVA